MRRRAEPASAPATIRGLERRDVRVYTHRYTKGYPTDVDLIVSIAHATVSEAPVAVQTA